MLKSLTRWLSARRATRLEADRRAARNALRRRRYAALKAERIKAQLYANPRNIFRCVARGCDGCRVCRPDIVSVADSATPARDAACRYCAGDGCGVCAAPPGYEVVELPAKP